MTQVPMEWHELRDLIMRVGDPCIELPARKRMDSLNFSCNNDKSDTTKRTASRLDRLYVPTDWYAKVDSYGIISVTKLSDHAPVFLNLKTGQDGT